MEGKEESKTPQIESNGKQVPIIFIIGNTYEHLENPRKTKEGKDKEHRWTAFVKA